MRTLFGLMSAYWKSSEWKTAWSLTAGIIILTAAMSKGSVFIAEYAANFMASVLQLAPGAPVEPGLALGSSALFLAAAIGGRTAIEASRHFISATLHRKWRGWLNQEFNKAVLQDRHYLHVLHNQDYNPADPDSMPDNLDQRLQESPKAMTGGAIGLAMGIWGVATSLFFIGQKLLEISTPVQGLEFLGSYGSLTLAFGAAVAYVPVNTFIALKIGKAIERLNILSQQTEGTYRGELCSFFRNALQVAAARGERVQGKIYNRLYEDVDGVWHRQNIVAASFMGFHNFQGLLQHKIVSYLPALPSLAQGALSVKGYLTGSELVSHLIGDCSWLINVMPAVANVRAHSRRLMEVSNALEKVHASREYYARTGIAEVHFHEEDGRQGVRVDRNFELYHRGETEPFLVTGELAFKPGKWTAVMGSSGSGKSTLVKAMFDLWPYGRGDIHFSRGARLMFASQEPFIPRTSLKQNICLPGDESDYSDMTVAAVMEKIGMESFIGQAKDELYNGKPWDSVLSGGQKQLVVLGRILLQKPDVLILDEATSAMDEKTKILFHALLKEHCPETVVVSIIHDKSLLDVVPDTGKSFYDSVVRLRKGKAVQREIRGRGMIPPHGGPPPPQMPQP